MKKEKIHTGDDTLCTSLSWVVSSVSPVADNRHLSWFKKHFGDPAFNFFVFSHAAEA